MTDTTTAKGWKEEIERLNPHFKWSKRKVRSEHNSRVRDLKRGLYAFGCSGHPGIIVETNIYFDDLWGSDVQIKSLINGNVESCSVMHCNPQPLTKEFALEYADYMKRNGSTMALIKFSRHSYEDWERQYNDPSETSEYKEGKTLQEYLNMNDQEFHAYQSGELPE